MSDDDPVPLKAGGEAAPELIHALYALGGVRLDPGRRARLAERLAAPRAAAGDGRATASRLWAKLVRLTGVAIGLSALSWLGYWIAR